MENKETFEGKVINKDGSEVKESKVRKVAGFVKHHTKEIAVGAAIVVVGVVGYKAGAASVINEDVVNDVAETVEEVCNVTEF